MWKYTEIIVLVGVCMGGVTDFVNSFFFLFFSSLKHHERQQSIPFKFHVLCASRTDCTSRMTQSAIFALQSIGAKSFKPGFGTSLCLLNVYTFCIYTL